MKTYLHQSWKQIGLIGLTTLAFGCLGIINARAAKLSVTPPAGGPQSRLSAVRPPATASQAEDIRDIRPPFHIPYPWLWLVYPGAGLLAALAAYSAWQWGLRNRRQEERLPYELALEELEAARSLMRTEQARAFCITVSEVVRRYIEKRFVVRARSLTTWEFLQELAAGGDSPLAGYRPLLGEFLYHCDLAKFARWLLSLQEMEAMLQSACRFVRETGRPGQHLQNSPAQPVGTPALPSPGNARLFAPVSLPMANASPKPPGTLALERRRL
jgi:Domain of unknown function (DUF4381)